MTQPKEVKLCVGQVPNTCTEQQLFDLFQRYGRVLNILRNRPKGSAVVTFDSAHAAEEALKALNGVHTIPPNTTPLQIRHAEQTTPSQPPRGLRRPSPLGGVAPYSPPSSTPQMGTDYSAMTPATPADLPPLDSPLSSHRSPAYNGPPTVWDQQNPSPSPQSPHHSVIPNWALRTVASYHASPVHGSPTTSNHNSPLGQPQQSNVWDVPPPAYSPPSPQHPPSQHNSPLHAPPQTSWESMPQQSQHQPPSPLQPHSLHSSQWEVNPSTMPPPYSTGSPVPIPQVYSHTFTQQVPQHQPHQHQHQQHQHQHQHQ
eukprot:Sspe_Gene.62644::Locus_35310_Transcript_1_4_Confidence_0.400_Length_1037::g.62644::m.62644